MNEFYNALPAACIMCLVLFILFYSKSSLTSTSFNIILWVFIPLVAFTVSFFSQLVVQLMRDSEQERERKKHAEKGIQLSELNKEYYSVSNAFYGGIPSIIAVVIALGISSISYFRIPVASLFRSSYVKEMKQRAGSNSKRCCIEDVTLNQLESSGSGDMIKGAAYIFYAFFAMLFGIIIGFGISA